MKFGLLVALFGIAFSQSPQPSQTSQYQPLVLGKSNSYVNTQSEANNFSPLSRPQNPKPDQFKSQFGYQNQGFNPLPATNIERPKTPIIGQFRPESNNFRPQQQFSRQSLPYHKNYNFEPNQKYHDNRRSQSFDIFQRNQVFDPRPYPYYERRVQDNRRRNDIRDEDDYPAPFDWRSNQPSYQNRRDYPSSNMRGNERQDWNRGRDFVDFRNNDIRRFDYDQNDRAVFRRERDIYNRFENDGRSRFDNRRSFSNDYRREFLNDDRIRNSQNMNFKKGDNFKNQRFPIPNRQFETQQNQRLDFSNPILNQKNIQQPSKREFESLILVQQQRPQPQPQPQPRPQPQFQQSQLQTQSQSPSQSQFQQRQQAKPVEQVKKPIQSFNSINDFVLQQQEQLKKIMNTQLPASNLNNFNTNANTLNNQVKLPTFTDLSSNANNVLPRPVEIPRIPKFNNWNTMAFFNQKVNAPQPTPQFPF